MKSLERPYPCGNQGGTAVKFVLSSLRHENALGIFSLPAGQMKEMGAQEAPASPHQAAAPKKMRDFPPEKAGQSLPGEELFSLVCFLCFPKARRLPFPEKGAGTASNTR